MINNVKYYKDVCSADELTCMRARNPTGFVCETCEPNSIETCRPMVDIDLERFNKMTLDASFPCWVYDYTPFSEDALALQMTSSMFNRQDDESKSYRVYLANPNILLNYPEISPWWRVGVCVASLFFFISVYSLFKGHACSPRYCKTLCRSVSRPQTVYEQDHDNGARCCFCFRTRGSYSRFADSHPAQANGHT